MSKFEFENGAPVPSVDPVYFDDAPQQDGPSLSTTPLQAAALRYLMHVETRPMDEVAEECGVSQQAVSDMVAGLYRRLGFRRSRKKRTDATA